MPRSVSAVLFVPVLKPVAPALLAAIPLSAFHNPASAAGSLSLWTSEDTSPRASDPLLLAWWLLLAAAAWLNLGRALGHRPGTPWLLSWVGASVVWLSPFTASWWGFSSVASRERVCERLIS